MQGRYQDAVKPLSEAVRLKPDKGDYHFNLANALAGLGKHKESFEHYSKAAALNPADTEFQQTLRQAKSRVARSNIN